MADSSATSPIEFLGNFGFAVRTLYLDASDLSLRRGWSTGWLAQDDRSWTDDESIVETISGKASLEDAITVIGSSREATRELEITFRRSSQMDRGARWKELIENRRAGDELREPIQDHEEGRARLERVVNERLDASPPSFTIGFTPRDRELGWQDSWWVECLLPSPIFDSLSRDLQLGAVRGKTKVAARLDPTLIDSKYAPPAERVTFGLVVDRGDNSAAANGWITNIGWEAAESVNSKSAGVRPKDLTLEGTDEVRGQSEGNAELQRIASSVERMTELSKRTIIALLVLLLAVIFLG